MVQRHPASKHATGGTWYSRLERNNFSRGWSPQEVAANRNLKVVDWMNESRLDRYPFSPFPVSWYWLDFSENLKNGELRSKTWLGKQVIYWRDEEGKVCLANAICPHLGANLAPRWGGKVERGQLVCPFHGLKYNTIGQCVHSPLGELKQPVSLKTFPILETSGVIFAYWHPTGREPTWSLPNLEEEGWSKFIHQKQEIATHPQETAENAVDLSHLNYVHGYENVHSLGPLLIEGHKLQNRFRLTRHIGPNEKIGLKLTLNITVSIYGIGVSTVEPVMDSAGLYIRQLAMCTPIDGEKVNFVMALQMKEIERPNAIMPGLGLIPRRLLNGIFRKIFLKVACTDLSQDFPIWENKQYLTYPSILVRATS